MLEVRTTPDFDRWFRKLKDRKARAFVRVRLDRLSLGLFGDAKSVGDGVSELRIDYGPGYRLYFCQRGRTVIVVLLGGDKRRQQADIEKAKAAARQLEDNR